MSESRTFLLSRETINTLRTGHLSDATMGEYEQFTHALPEALSPEEIADVGLQVANAAELENPSPLGYKRGLKEESLVIWALGFNSIQQGDLVTAESAHDHLKNMRMLDSFLRALSLRRHINKKD